MMNWANISKVLEHYPYIAIAFLALLAMVVVAVIGKTKWLEALWVDPYVSAVFRLILGASFIVASLSKIPHPAEFSENVAGFMMVPFWGVNFMGLVMPWSELVSGLFLILGIRTRAAASIVGLLLGVFIVGLTVNLIKGTPINCGCFESVGEPINWDLVVRDTLMLIMVFQIFFHDRLFVFDRGGFIWRERKI